MPSAEELRERIVQALPGADVRVEDTTGGGDHFRAEVVSDRFEGLSRIQQHKLIYDVFGNEVGGAIHALSIKTQTPKQSETPAGDARR
ncbi:MAG TPA: BolA family protein [Thermoleophilaceae bacterium]|nr:BolA family protein [Thermoleophilaceae bacterium]